MWYNDAFAGWTTYLYGVLDSCSSLHTTAATAVAGEIVNNESAVRWSYILLLKSSSFSIFMIPTQITSKSSQYLLRPQIHLW